MSKRFVNLDECELVGHVGVDSGQMLLLDPCYIESHWDEKDFDLDNQEPTGEVNYHGACTATLSPKQSGVLGGGIAAVCSTGFGDGQYPVYVEVSDEGAWGKRVKSMTIVFIDDSEDEDEYVCDDCGAEIGGFGGDLCDDCDQEDDDA